MTRPLCFVLMPPGQKPTASGFVVNFDAGYRDLIAPAISDAGMDPLRADQGRQRRRHAGWLAGPKTPCGASTGN